MKQYWKDKLAFDSLRKERKNHEPPVMPPNRMFLIPGNNSGTGILENIIDSGGTGLIFECEAEKLYYNNRRACVCETSWALSQLSPNVVRNNDSPSAEQTVIVRRYD